MEIKEFPKCRTSLGGAKECQGILVPLGAVSYHEKVAIEIAQWKCTECGKTISTDSMFHEKE